MGMDGLYRPSQALGYTDALGHLGAAERAAQQAKQSSQIDQNQSVDRIDKDPQQKEEHEGRENSSPKEEQDAVLAEELKEILALRFNIEFKLGIVYRLLFNRFTERFELVDTSVSRVILSLTSEAFLQVMADLEQTSGIISNRIA